MKPQTLRRSCIRSLAKLAALLLCVVTALSGCTAAGPESAPSASGEIPAAVPDSAPDTFSLSDTAGSYSPMLDLLDLSYGSENATKELRVASDSSLGEEEFRLEITQNSVTITASCETGVFRALSRISRMSALGALPEADLSESPSVPCRGVIEGFYGTAWSQEYRLDLMKFMGKTGLNMYIYAPKDDLKHREQWRRAYTAAELEKLAQLASRAAEYKVKFVYAISPGLDISLGSRYEKDREKLFEKCESMYSIGVRNFAILLDDISSRDEEGHARLLNDFQTLFVETHEGTEDLIAITPEFCQAMVTSYTDGIAPLLNKKITLMWTGNGVIPSSITPEDLKYITEKLGRKVLIWWNYPVNDTMADRMFLGPCEGLSPDLDGSICGLVSNPMNQGYASFGPLYTVSDYLRDTAGYDADASLDMAARFLYPDCYQEYLVFADLMRASLINGGHSSYKISGDVDAYCRGSTDPELPERLTAQLDGIISALNVLTEKADPAFIAEADRFIAKASALASNAKALFSLEKLAQDSAAAGTIDRDSALKLCDELTASRSVARKYGVTVSPDVLTRLYELSQTRVGELMSGYGIELAFLPEAITNCSTYQDYTLDKILDGDDTTFFWTAGALSYDKNDPGYIGVDLGKVTGITKIYITTGQNCRDALVTAVVEYSTDGKTWTELASGRLGDSILLEPEGISGRYVRIRGGNPSETNWVIVRTFEVN